MTARPMYAYFWGAITNGVRLFMSVYSNVINSKFGYHHDLDFKYSHVIFITVDKIFPFKTMQM